MTRLRASLCAVLVGVFYLSTLRAGHEWGDDFSMYMAHARNIATGAPYADTGYIYNPQNPGVGPRTYPPGFPFLLAPVVKAFGLETGPMKIEVTAFFVGSLLMMVPLFRRLLTPPDLAWLVLGVGLSPVFWDLKDQILSDAPFLFFTLASLELFALADDPGPPPRYASVLAVLSGVVGYIAYAIRVLGLVLVPCFLVYDLIRHRRVRMRSALAGVVLIALATIQFVFWIHDGSYLDQLSNVGAAARRNVPDYLRSLSALWDNGYADLFRKVMFLATALLAGFGYLRSVRTGPSVLHIFPWVYIVPVIFWPSFQGIRFLVPIVPFYIAFTLAGVRAADTAIDLRFGLRAVLLATFFVAATVSYGARYSTLPFTRFPRGIEARESVELFNFVRTATDTHDVLVFSQPRALALFTGRRVSAAFSAADPCALWRYLHAIDAAYVITGPDNDPFNADAAYLGRFVSAFRDASR